MILRLAAATLAFVAAAAPQDLPSFRWVKQVDAFGQNNSVAGLGTDAQGNVYIAGSTSTAHFPVADLPTAVAFEIRSGGLSSNSVLMPVATTSPGIYSQDGSGHGQGYIRNQDGTLNSPSNPARRGEKVTIFATGMGPMTFTDCCAVTETPVDVFFDNFYCYGVAAVAGPVSGFAGNVYRITVYVPDPAALLAGTGRSFVFPPQDQVDLRMNGIRSQSGIEISIAQ
jgi:uncharacterized protein (TIGR03437 family)